MSRSCGVHIYHRQKGGILPRSHFGHNRVDHHHLERGCREVVAYIFIIAKREGYCQRVILDTPESIITTLREGVEKLWRTYLSSPKGRDTVKESFCESGLSRTPGRVEVGGMIIGLIQIQSEMTHACMCHKQSNLPKSVTFLVLQCISNTRALSLQSLLQTTSLSFYETKYFKYIFNPHLHVQWHSILDTLTVFTEC